LVADRGFPSRHLLLVLRQVRWGWTLRLRANSWLSVADQSQSVRELLARTAASGWRLWAAHYGQGPRALPGNLVIGQGLVVLPWHQRQPGSLRHRAAQRAERQRHLRTKHPERARPTTATQTDAWMVLFTSHATWQPAVRSYGRRWAIEGSYRDAKTGWDGQHGWELDAALARLSDALVVERVVGLWALGVLVQTWVGHRLSQPTAPLPVPLLRREWTTTGRLSVWAKGQLALTDPSGRFRPCLRLILTAGARQLSTGPLPVRTPASHPQRLTCVQHTAA
jgi:hypothetical protein